MLPSLVAEELRRTLTDFLGTTFALTDTDVRAGLENFLLDPEQGIFRGPFVRARLPFRPADDDWRAHLDWAPSGFHPHAHQAKAFARLSTKTGPAEPVIVTTGTGSGKTESFLIPVLDHCRRAKAAGQQGVKALILYPMNALANDQARRIAELLTADPDLAGLTAGLYTGDGGTMQTVAEGRLIDDRHTLRTHPPDILLTNYKMLDFLLLRSEDRPLWHGAADSLRYLVLDEFHTYDGAQGTDVAMLLRRFAATLDLARPGQLLGDVVPVATSATLGDGAAGRRHLLDFAAQVFGTTFTEEALVDEDRVTPSEWHRSPQANAVLPKAAVCELVYERLGDDGVENHERIATATWALLFDQALQWVDGEELALPPPEQLGTALRGHPLVNALLQHAATPIAVGDLADHLLRTWTKDERRRQGRTLLGGVLALISQAVDPDYLPTPERPSRPLLLTEVQVWVREVSRLLRQVGDGGTFRWQSDHTENAALEPYLPAIYCRTCGRSGWAAARPPSGHSLIIDPLTIYREQVRHPERVVSLMHAPGEAAAQAEPGLVQWFEPSSGRLLAQRPDDDAEVVPVLPPGDADASRADRCPACEIKDSVRFLGSRVATLTSVLLGHVFGSNNVEASAKKTLVFTDSVQDAAHRAAFIESRAYALNQRALIATVLSKGETTLDELGQRLLDHLLPLPATDRYAAIPPELKDHHGFMPFWSDDAPPTTRTRRLVKERLQFNALLEFGLNARTGRTLELTGAVRTEVAVDNPRRLLRDISAKLDELPAELLFREDEPPLRQWIWGILDRMRTAGAVEHEWFERYLNEDGNRWSIWGGRNRDRGMPAFPADRPAPAYPVTSAPASAKDPFPVITSPRGWYAHWTSRSLGIPAQHAGALLLALFDVLTEHGVVVQRSTASGAKAWWIPPSRIVLRAQGVAPSASERVLICSACAQRIPGTAHHIEALADAPCLRDQCPGHLEPHAVRPDYYRSLYLGGQVRRIVASEHTGLLDGDERAAIESNFKKPTGADAPNVLACTPTLELGIDIGDLSMVALTSLPRSTAAYLQRVGRAGRQTGSSLVICVLPSRALELHHLADPLSMIAGEVRPPACHLDAVEILHRQFLAYLIDRRASSGRPSPRRLSACLAHGVEPGSWFGDLLAPLRTEAAAQVESFLALFEGEITEATREDLLAYASVGDDGSPSPLQHQVALAAERWRGALEESGRRIRSLSAELARLDDLGEAADNEVKTDRRRVRGELFRAKKARLDLLNTYWLAGLEAAGLLPNYALLDDRTVLDVTLWWTDEETGRPNHAETSYARGSRTAIAELAPGAMFYVRGSAVRIDGLEVGNNVDDAMLALRTCPSCGWAEADTGPRPCPRCGNPRAADSGQVIPALPFRGATAFLARERARAGDTHDDRERVGFTLITSVDVDPTQITAAWRLADYPFGVEFSRRAEVRWLNLGPEAVGGSTRYVAGYEVQAPLFRTCRHCGVVPAAQVGANGARVTEHTVRHRGWCPQRQEPTGHDPEGWASIALTHSLQTQVLRLLVPPILTADDTLLVSFRAALMMGLQKLFGGDPDHLNIVGASMAGETGQRWVMALHDLVPGGTGYLAQLADPVRVHHLLSAAREQLAACECANEGLMACHRCLLAHVRSSRDAEYARRDHAIEVLDAILDNWKPIEVSGLSDITVGPHESPLEERFREALRRWLLSRGVQPAITPTANGDRWDFGLTNEGATRTWTLRPQVRLGGVQPDFVLNAPGVRRSIAVFCDGLAYHNHPEHNRVSDDATKRDQLTDQGYLVWAISHEDIDSFLHHEAEWDQQISLRSPTPMGLRWAKPSPAEEFPKLARALSAHLPGGGAVSANALTGDAMSVLTRYLLKPDPSAWRSASVATAVAIANLRSQRVMTAQQARAAAIEASGGPHLGTPPASPATPGLGGCVTTSAHGVGIVVRQRNTPDVRVDVVLALDDRPEVIGSPDQVQAWLDWLALSNVLRLAGTDVVNVEAISVQQVLDDPSADRVPKQVESSVETYLAELLTEVDERAHGLVSQLSREAADTVRIGYETDDGIPLQLAWPELKIAVVLPEDTDGLSWLREHQWSTAIVGQDDATTALSAAGLLSERA